MKKLLGIVVLSLLLSGNAFAATIKYMFKTKIKCDGFYSKGSYSDILAGNYQTSESAAGDIYLAFDRKTIMTDWDSVNQEFKQKYKIIFYGLDEIRSETDSMTVNYVKLNRIWGTGSLGLNNRLKNCVEINSLPKKKIKQKF